jgi:hypothetical protein
MFYKSLLPGHVSLLHEPVRPRKNSGGRGHERAKQRHCENTTKTYQADADDLGTYRPRSYVRGSGGAYLSVFTQAFHLHEVRWFHRFAKARLAQCARLHDIKWPRSFHCRDILR